MKSDDMYEKLYAMCILTRMFREIVDRTSALTREFDGDPLGAGMAFSNYVVARDALFDSMKLCWEDLFPEAAEVAEAIPASYVAERIDVLMNAIKN